MDRHVPYADIFAKTIAQFALGMGRSLRDLEQICASCGAALSTMQEGEDVEPAYYAYLILAHEACPQAYNTFVEGGSPVEFAASITKAFPAHRLEGNSPLAVIVLECLNVQHLLESDIKQRFAELDEAVRDPAFDDDGRPYRRYSYEDERFIRWALLANGAARIKNAPRLVKFAKRFERPE